MQYGNVKVAMRNNNNIRLFIAELDTQGGLSAIHCQHLHIVLSPTVLIPGRLKFQII